MYNPGKYDAVCTMVREATEAESVVVIVIKGKLGSGFSVQASPETLAKLPDTLEVMAIKIREGSQ